MIVTGDRDILQMVDEHIRVLTSGRSFSDTIIYDPAAVQEKYGLRPDQLVDLKALVGDKSDNIPGVTGHRREGRDRPAAKVRHAGRRSTRIWTRSSPTGRRRRWRKGEPTPS